MKKLALAISILVVSAVSASAADMAPAPRTYAKAAPPPVVMAYNWTGCYLGGYVGGATQSRSVNTIDPISAAGGFYNLPTTTPPGTYSYDVGSSVIGGGTLGCNWQGASPWVVGVEGEAGYMRLTGSRIDPYSIPAFGSDTTDSTRIGDWYGVIAGRLGYAWDRFLVYGKGGVGFANVQSSVIDTCTVAPCGNAAIAAYGSSNQAFWVAGGGVEYAFNPSWSVKAEYLFLGIEKTYAVCGTASAGAIAGVNYCSNHNLEGVHTFKVGLNYHFNSPVVARY
jgi:outer membrane immunogenic protein